MLKWLNVIIFIFAVITISTSFLNWLSDSDLLFPFNQNAYAHDFTPNESASFLAFVEQLRVESELVQVNLAENNVPLAQQHADKAAALLTSNITKEIAEQNQRVADDITTAVKKLQNISSQQQGQPQQQSISLLENELDAILGEVLTTRLDREQRDNATI